MRLFTAVLKNTSCLTTQDTISCITSDMNEQNVPLVSCDICENETKTFLSNLTQWLQTKQKVLWSKLIIPLTKVDLSRFHCFVCQETISGRFVRLNARPSVRRSSSPVLSLQREFQENLRLSELRGNSSSPVLLSRSLSVLQVVWWNVTGCWKLQNARRGKL